MHSWIGKIHYPPKIKFLLWLAQHNHLPTKLTLSLMGLKIAPCALAVTTPRRTYSISSFNALNLLKFWTQLWIEVMLLASPSASFTYRIRLAPRENLRTLSLTMFSNGKIFSPLPIGQSGKIETKTPSNTRETSPNSLIFRLRVLNYTILLVIKPLILVG